MKRTATILALTILALSLSLGACSEPEATVIDITEDIVEDATWSGQVNVSGEISIENNAALTIEPGTIVRFAHGAGLEVFYGSSIRAIGTADGWISFSCANEGDEWMGIYYDDDVTESEFAYCDFSDAGFGNTYAIGLDDNGIITVAYCDFDGNHAGGLNTGYAATGTIIDHCYFGDNGDSESGPYDLVFDSRTCSLGDIDCNTQYDLAP